MVGHSTGEEVTRHFGRHQAVPASPDTEVNTALSFVTPAAQQERLDAVLAERTRLAGELHDTLLQTFTGVMLQLQALRGRMLSAPREAEQDLGRVLNAADAALRDARAAVWDMRVPSLEERDVAAALEGAAREAVALHRIAAAAEVDLEVTITGDRRRLSPAVETAAHRVGREAVANALRHADAKHIRVAIAFESRHLCVGVCDDGVGFDMALLHPTAGRGHWGLVGMGERARTARGTLDVRSAPGSGTAVQLRVPVDSA
jgi:signal transduction histidine kinase